MLWLIWQIWIFLFIAFGLGLALGWRLWSASGETGKALQDANEQIGRLQRENDSLTRLVAQNQADREEVSQAQPAAAGARSGSEPVKTGAATKSPDAAKPKAAKPRATKPRTTKPAATKPKSEKPKAARKKAAAPKSAAKSTPAKPDDLTELKGLGPKAAEALNAEGVTTFAQIAAWSKTDVERWDEKLTARGRITRDDWVGQAKAKSG